MFRMSFVAALAVACMVPGTAPAQVTSTLIDFEAPGFDASSISAVGDAGFDFFFAGTEGVPGDSEFDNFSGFIPSAPSLDINAPTIVTVAFDDAALSGSQSLVFFADVNSSLFQDDPAVNNDPRLLSLNVFQQQTITADDIGSVVEFSLLFSGAEGSQITSPNTSVEAFLITLDPENNFNTTNSAELDLSDAVLGTTESGLLTLDLSAPELEGQILQFGVRNTFADGENPAVIVDDLQLIVDGEIPGADLAGDFNGDEAVNAADFVIFRDGASPNGLESLEDFNAFAAGFTAAGSPAVSSAVANVPEPSALLLLVVGFSAVAARRR